MKKKIWFKAKRYGWGWYPSTWQGWLATILYILFIVKTPLFIDVESSSGNAMWAIFIPVIIATVLLIALCYLKGEKPEWRWGDKDVIK